MSHWTHVADGEALRLFTAMNARISSRWQVHEYLLLRLGGAGVTIDRFPAFGFLACVEGSRSVSSRLLQTELRLANSWEVCAQSHGDFWKNYGCVKHAAGVLSRAKYVEEFVQAVVVAGCLAENLAVWSEEYVKKCFCGKRRSDAFYGNVFHQAVGLGRLCFNSF